MSTVRKTVTFTEQQDKWIKAQIEAGEYTNDSEYLRDLVRQDQAKNNATRDNERGRNSYEKGWTFINSPGGRNLIWLKFMRRVFSNLVSYRLKNIF